MMSVTSDFNSRGQSVEPEHPVRIFLDLDGVIADFAQHAAAQGKRKSNGWLNYPELDQEWWTTIPAYKGAKKFYRELCRRGPVKFLTATPPASGFPSYSGKAAWVMKFCGGGTKGLKDLIISPRADKCLLAGPGRILIDDKAENIAEWNRAGGIGIHHTGDFADTLRRLDEALSVLNPGLKNRDPNLRM